MKVIQRRTVRKKKKMMRKKRKIMREEMEITEEMMTEGMVKKKRKMMKEEVEMKEEMKKETREEMMKRKRRIKKERTTHRSIWIRVQVRPLVDTPRTLVDQPHLPVATLLPPVDSLQHPLA